MKNKLSNLKDHLFAQMDRLSDEDLKGDALIEEIERAKAVTAVAKEIIGNGRLVLDAKVKVGDLIRQEDVPAMLK